MSRDPARAIYAANSAELAARYEEISVSGHFAPVIDLFPAPPARIADIGAGSGRDASWFAELGHKVVAAEPVAELRAEAMRRHPDADVCWIADGLPDLALLSARPGFDLLTVSAVWHHVPPDNRADAMRNLAALLAPDGLLVMSLRHGPLAVERGVFPPDAGGAIALAEAQGLRLQRCVRVDAQQQDSRLAGIIWEWLALSQQP
ncbi:class I SAM-dependent methyltransferase [Paracoccus tegillarcae]|uniref:SAM-dependent methyltransferase n=1 Tax=Paracoccus tegillarcae TaxID=1529068 RepID=A0A2K9EG65_9RHOB|nr:class I SAM-dependent methyltransferase [Paracoccus tegillarcae]AUH33960.1 SAM-dependent methyltransferase [Paracoccus tegillarcae]